jgi:hypothetical protein
MPMPTAKRPGKHPVLLGKMKKNKFFKIEGEAGVLQFAQRRKN